MAKKIPKIPFISIIVPLYNEVNRLDNISSIYKYFNLAKITFEVILINDGSKDETEEKLKKIYKNFKFKLISYPENRGKGYAIKMGMMQAQGKYRLFTDIDLSSPIREFNKFFPYLRNHYLKKNAILIGSRKIKGSQLDKRQPYLRELLGKGFTFLSQRILDLNVSDFTCGFKCFSKKAAEDIFRRQCIEGWGFDSEILFISKKIGYRIKEIPVTWSDNPRSKVKFPQDIIRSLKDLFTIRLNDIKGKYEK